MIMPTQRKFKRIQWWKEHQKKKRKKSKDKNGISATKTVETHPAQVSTSKRGFRSRVEGTSVKLSQSDPGSVREDLVTAACSSDDGSCNEDTETADCVTKPTKTDTCSPVHSKHSHEEKAKTTPHLNRRYILFLGNLSLTSTTEDILTHFKKRGVPIKDLRLLTHKDTGKSRGCAFAEFETDRALKNALKFHRSKLNGKTINIEVTCGGGGTGTCRKTKIMEKNKRQRSGRAGKSSV